MVTPDDLARALAARDLLDIPALPGRTNHLRAGVLVPIEWAAGEPVVVATLRASRLRQHAGEVAFPGGKPDPGDRDLEHTALREAEEEIGLPPARVQVLGALSAMPLFTSDYRLVPTVAAIEPGPLVPEPGEVAEVLRLSLTAVLEGPALDGVPWTYEGETGISPVFELGGHVMYGATAHTLHELLQVVAAAAGMALPPWRTGRFAWGGRGVVRV